LRTPAGSAIAAKGVLAVAAACGGHQIAPAAHRYIKEWYGTRAGQGKALIGMLAWVDHPTATQLMLSIGSRFRTKGFQVEATSQAQLLAERRGWTLDELSDRTIPTAGFDETGQATIDYGSRVFTARLTTEFEVELHNSDGKKIANLPDARGDEDQARVKEAKKQFSAAKKELKGVLALQRERLYEALCTQRRWRFEDWSIYLNRHPIVRHYCKQLVWVAVRAGTTPVTFRPLDDGSLTDLADDSVALAPDDGVTLAHDTNAPPDASAAWLQHFQDFKVVPLFQQFGTPCPARCRTRPRLSTSRATLCRPLRYGAAPRSSATPAAPQRTAAGFIVTRSGFLPSASRPTWSSAAARSGSRIAWWPCSRCDLSASFRITAPASRWCSATYLPFCSASPGTTCA
jgi:hypothetical protein